MQPTEYAGKDEDWRAGGFGVYVHWPFCLAKCPYCDFNSHVAKAPPDQADWTAALVAEIHATAAETGPRRVDSVFFGGGTPSLMDPSTVGAVIDAIGAAWSLGDEAEINLEANPTSVEAGRFAGYAAAGVNRVSMGVQALNDADLKALGRMHSAAEARAAFDIARARFARVSFDLIYARQGQTEAAWEAELRAALSMAVDHLSLYQLTIEPGTRFGDLHARGRLRDLPSDDLSADLYALTQAICADAGAPGYEVSNHARKGAESRHNLLYWRTGDYAGIGPGAHGRLTLDGRRWGTESLADPAQWLAATRAAPLSARGAEALDDADRAAEHLLMGLRLDEGVSLARHQALAGAPLDPQAIKDLEGMGLVERNGDRLRVPPAGRPVLNAILRELL
ncbi:radical SAM family heme chaperone HemW [Rhodovulum sp. DZ06]|uniref:radical SAM family heme chaperone HemW n=1 Tax=Rhodovulum sp. DZ06 TaxID=3425126 RepID=UPI003D3574C9